ncbi:Ribosome-recycling factor [subsurface metagenome]
MPVKQIISEHKEKMEKCVEHLTDELKATRTGRASTGLVENIKVDYYGTATPLKHLATLAVPQADMIVIKPFDAAAAKEIEKAIKNTSLSIAPVMDGKIIRLNIPSLSEERRKQLVSQVKQTGEQTKVIIRNIRRDANKQLEKEEKEKLITEDDHEVGKKQVDDITKEYSDKVEAVIKSKSEEIMLN